MKRLLLLAAAFILVLPAPSFAAEETAPAPAESPYASKEGVIKTTVKSGIKSAPKAVKTAAAKSEAKPEDDGKKTVKKTVRGKVMGAMKRALSLGLVSDDADAPSEEMLLSLDGDTEFLNVSDPAELKYGDGVKVDYELVYRENKQTKDREYLSTTAKRITLIQKAKPAKALQAGEADEE